MKKVGALALFVLCVLVTAASAQAADQSNGPGLPEKCEPGRTDYSTDMAEIKRYPDGGSTYTYQVNSTGQTETIGQPPPGFDPLKASNEELARYAFPPRPEDIGGKGWTQESLAEWEGLVSNYKEAALPVTCGGPTAPYSTNDEPIEYLHYSKNWSGHIQHVEGFGERAVATIGKFYEPSGNAHKSCKENALVANWMGLGGYGTQSLIQDGTGTATNNQHTAWWMALEPGEGDVPPQYFPNLIFGENSYMGFYAGYNLAEYRAYFYLSNESTGQVIPVYSGLGTNYYDGSTAEAITERPSAPTGLYPLLNFSKETFWNVTYQNNYNLVSGIGEGYNHQIIDMTNTGTSGGTLLSEPSGLSLNQNYSVNYKNCQ
jgi:hypothetical protein